MHIELIDLLRCPSDHEESWLVAAFRAISDRYVLSGKLGCPVCSGSYSIHGGMADFRGAGRELGPSATAARNPGASARSGKEDDAVRIAAMLDLTRPGATVLLEGALCRHAMQICELTGVRVLAIDPDEAPTEAERLAVILTDGRLPLARGSVDGIAFGSAPAEGRLSEAARVLRSGGRVVAPASAALSPAFRELARDDRFVVAEAAGELVRLSR